MMLKDSYTVEELDAHRHEWLAALRSGKYKQGRMYLRDNNDNYCCLGIACEVAGVESEIKQVSYDTLQAHFYQSSAMSLDKNIQRYYGLRSGIGDPVNRNKLITLSDLNDLKKLTFSQIADIIEDNWSEYFTNEID